MIVYVVETEYVFVKLAPPGKIRDGSISDRPIRSWGSILLVSGGLTAVGVRVRTGATDKVRTLLAGFDDAVDIDNRSLALAVGAGDFGGWRWGWSCDAQADEESEWKDWSHHLVYDRQVQDKVYSIVSRSRCEQWIWYSILRTETSCHHHYVWALGLLLKQRSAPPPRCHQSSTFPHSTLVPVPFPSTLPRCGKGDRSLDEA